MKLTLLIIPLLLSSCGGFIKTDSNGSTIVQGGFLSSIAGFSGKVTTPNGATVVWSQTGYDGTGVANTAIGGYGLAKTIEGASHVSDNVVKTTKIKSTPTVTTPTVDPTTGQLLNPKVTFPPQ